MLDSKLVKDIKELVSFLNVVACDVEEDLKKDVIYIGIGVKNAGIGSLQPTRIRLETELSLLVQSHITKVKGYSGEVVVDIGCC